MLGYTVHTVFAENDNGGKKNLRGIEIELYKEKELLSTLTLKDYTKHTSGTGNWIDGTFDVFGDYDSNSWVQEGYWNLTDIPTHAVVKVKFADGNVAEAEITLKSDADVTPFFVEAVNRAQTAEEMSRALINLEAQMTDKTDFTNLPKAAKLEVAELTLAARAEEEEGIDGIPNTAGKFFKDNKLDADYVIGVVGTAITGYEAYIKRVNEVVTGTDAEPTIAGMRTALLNKAETYFPEFAKLSAADQTLKAEAVLNALLEMQADEDNPQEFKTIAEIKAAAGL